MSRPRFGYLLPIYRRRSGEHFAHVVRLLEVLGEEFDIEVVPWECYDEPDLPWAAEVHVLQAQSKPARMWELRQLVRRRLAAGCRRWFIRTAAPPALAIAAGGAETVYWLGATKRPPNPGVTGQVQRQLVNLAHRRVSVIATPPGMEEYNTRVWGIPTARQVPLDNDLDTAVYQPLDATARLAVRAELGVPPEATLLLYVHRLTHWRGAHWLIPVIEACRAEGHEVCLVAVGGEGDQSTELNAYAAAHPATLKLLGHRPNDELPPLYGAADLFLMPSRAEAFPRVVLEAMACGAPVVSTDVGTVARIIPPSWHAETLAPAEDLTAFCARTVALVGETDTRARMAAELRQRALDYDVRRVAEQYRDLLTRPL